VAGAIHPVAVSPPAVAIHRAAVSLPAVGVLPAAVSLPVAVIHLVGVSLPVVGVLPAAVSLPVAASLPAVAVHLVAVHLVAVHLVAVGAHPVVARPVVTVHPAAVGMALRPVAGVMGLLSTVHPAARLPTAVAALLRRPTSTVRLRLGRVDRASKPARPSVSAGTR